MGALGGLGRGHLTDDLTSLLAALKTLDLQDTPLHEALERQLAEEAEERDNDEPGEFGQDFQGGSVGF